MTQNDCIPPIEDLLPHRGSMLLLDRISHFDADTACGEYRPRADAWYANHEGNMPAWIGLELMAQAIAAHVALLRRHHGPPPRQGVLLGTRRYASSAQDFKANSILRIHVRMILCDTSGLGAYDCHIESENEELATATLKVFEPEDFHTFLQSSTP